MPGREVRTEVVIAAPPERVWAIFMDWGAYSQWNTFIKTLEGKPEVGARLKLEVQPPGKGVSGFAPTVLAATPSREFRWCGKLWGLPGLFTGVHYFLLEPTGPGGSHTKFVHGESFTGLLIPVVGAADWAAIELGFEEMNAALKARAEAAVAAGGSS